MKKIMLGLLLISANPAFALPAIPPQPESDDLTLYNACTNEWVSTGLPYRAEPSFNVVPSVKKAAFLDRTYKFNGQDHRMNEVDIYNIEKHMKVGGANIPKSLRGIWWMDGNPVPEVVLSFGDATWDSTTGQLNNVFNGPNGYLVTASPLGRAWWDITSALNATIKVNFQSIPDLENPQFGDQMFIDFQAKALGVVDAQWPTHYINDQHWRRDTGDHCYNLRQIIDENGKKLPTYDYFVKQVREQTKKYLGKNPDVLLQARPTGK